MLLLLPRSMNMNAVFSFRYHFNNSIVPAMHTGGLQLLLQACLCITLSLLAGCTSSTPTTAPATFASGGIGLTKVEWEQHHTPSSAVPTQLFESTSYDNNQYGVFFWCDWPQNRCTAESRVSVIGFDTHSKLLDEQHAKIRALLPTDAQYQETIQHATGHFTELYYSALLASRYPPLDAVPDPWINSKPGTISVFYDSGGPIVRITAGIGSPPQPYLPTLTPLPLGSLPTPVRTLPLPMLTGEPLPRPVPTALTPHK